MGFLITITLLNAKNKENPISELLKFGSYGIIKLRRRKQMKITHDYIQRKRTEGTVFAVNSKIKGIPTEELITDLFLYTEDKIAMELVKRFESVLVKASMDSNFLKNNLHDFYIDNAKFLKENKLYKKFAEFTYFIYSNHSSGKSHSGAFSAYQDLLLQQFCYLAPPGKMVYGVTNNDELMMTDEVYPF